MLSPAEVLVESGAGAAANFPDSAYAAAGATVAERAEIYRDADMFALHAAGRTRVIAVECKLDDVNEAMTDVLAGRVPARVVFQF